ncbi:hypothetical protein B0T13DRAFT_502868 [Neurospora crassa]|nr:hypothetical protein B0T13DRAFT_502868 [Neurospora crassa]
MFRFDNWLDLHLLTLKWGFRSVKKMSNTHPDTQWQYEDHPPPCFLSVTTNPGGLQRPECRESRLGHTFLLMTGLGFPLSLWGFAFSKRAKDVDDEWIGGIAAMPAVEEVSCRGDCKLQRGVAAAAAAGDEVLITYLLAYLAAACSPCGLGAQGLPGNGAVEFWTQEQGCRMGVATHEGGGL